MDKKCPKCQNIRTKKFGFKRGKQRWKCNKCGYIFQNKSRKNTLQTEEMWNSYVYKRQTYEQLGKEYGYCTQTVQKKLDAFEVKKKNIYRERQYLSLTVLSFENGEKISLE